MKTYEIKIIINRPDARGFEPIGSATIIIKTDSEQKAMEVAESYPYFKNFVI